VEREPDTIMIPGSLAAHLAEIGSGTKTLPLFGRSRRHHFIPQFILRRFADRDTGLLYQLNIETGEITNPGPKGAGWAPKLYRVSDDQGRDNDFLEGFFSLVETHAADSIRALDDDPCGLSEGDRANIALILALQEGRTPGGYNRMLEAFTAIGRLQLDLMPQNPGAFSNIRGGKSAAGVEQLRKDALERFRNGRLELSATKELTLRTMIATWLERAAPIHAMSGLPCGRTAASS